MDKST